MKMKMQVELELIRVYFWTTDWKEVSTWIYCTECGYNSIEFPTFEEAILSAKKEIAELISEFGSLNPNNEVVGWFSDDEF